MKTQVKGQMRVVRSEGEEETKEEGEGGAGEEQERDPSTEVREGKLDLVKAEEVAVQPEEGALTNGILREGPGEEDNIEVEE